MTAQPPPWRRLLAWTAILLASIAWTVPAAYSVALGSFLAADTECGQNITNPHVDMEGVWSIIATLTIWSTPFIAAALRYRTPLTLTLGALTLCVSALVLIQTFSNPASFCW